MILRDENIVNHFQSKPRASGDDPTDLGTFSLWME